jgi:hypothetical protein
MKILKRSRRQRPRLSFVLLDWSVRESFHFLDYLSRQSVPRDEFEVVIIEYYSRESDALRRHPEVDTWALLGVPTTSCYHKHLMYNAGIVLARGEILVFCDSDAMARETLVGAILAAFDADPQIVLHLDQFRNMRRDFYPFNFPSFDDVLGSGCINNSGGRTKGVANPDDPLHDRNYGACMCARRQDLIAIGGADEHIDYLGHICGPYEMTFRLVNLGRREVWHDTEFLYHTWHPGQAGVDNYLGPHDGRHMSTTALEALLTRRVTPYVENQAIRMLREHPGSAQADGEARVVVPERTAGWTVRRQSTLETARPATDNRTVFDYRGFRVERQNERHVARLIVDDSRSSTAATVLEARTLEEIQANIDRAIRALPRAASALGSLYLGIVQVVGAGRVMLRRFAVQLRPLPRRTGHAAKALGRRTVDRVRRFRLEQTRTSGSLDSLIVNLHALRQRPDLAPEGRQPVFLTDARAVAYYMRALARIGVVPRLAVVLVRGADVTQWAIQAARPSGRSVQYLLGRDVYLKYHNIFAATGLARQMTVL